MVNSLYLNLNKTYYMKFKGTGKPLSNTTTICDDKQITIISEIKFLGTYVDDTIHWKDNVEHIIPKLSRACYIMRSIKPYLSFNILYVVYYSYFHSIMTYSLPF